MDRQIMRTGWWRTMYGRMVVALLLGAGACVAPQAKGGIVADSTSTEIPGPTDSGSNNDPPPCPPDSFTHTNNTTSPEKIIYACSNNTSTSVNVPSGGSITFKKNGVGLNAPDGDVPCGAVKVFVNRTLAFSCDMQTAYWDAYGIDLAAIGFTSTDANRPKKVYDSDGDMVLMHHYVVPIIDANGEFVDWEFTTIEPNFSVEDGEVVIRDNHNRVIGDRTGITLDD